VTDENVLTDSLPDGTLVTLNKHSRIYYPEKFTGVSRNISLQGEAFFSVAADAAHPFVIHINNVAIKVVGTSFNVRDIQGNTEVIVETGIVEVTGKSVSVRLQPKEKVVVNKKDSVLANEKVTGKLYNYYVTREFVCDGTPLWKLVEILNEAYEVNIVIGRKELKELPLTTTFDNESLDNILNIISQTFNIQVTRQEDKIVLE
jgi:ferric-dicitrate binding protein FerR (iron transport regulator)